MKKYKYTNNKVARNLLNSGKTIEEIVKIVQTQSNSAQMQLRILDGFVFAAHAQGRYPGGTVTLGDEISDKLAFQVRNYGNQAHRLSSKQVAIIIREVYEYRNFNQISSD